MSETSTNGAGDVVIDTTAQLDIGSAPAPLAPRGRILLIEGAAKAELHLRSFYLQEAQPIGFIMSGMTAAELAAAADRINATYPSRPLAVSVGRVLGFHAAAEAHAVLEAGRCRACPTEPSDASSSSPADRD